MNWSNHTHPIQSYNAGDQTAWPPGILQCRERGVRQDQVSSYRTTTRLQYHNTAILLCYYRQDQVSSYRTILLYYNTTILPYYFATILLY